MSVVLAAIFGALATATFTAVVGPLILASTEINKHDFEVAQRDLDLEEWIVLNDRKLLQRWEQLKEAANAAGTSLGGTLPAGRAVVQTQLLFDYREELRRANGFVLSLAIEEQWVHRLMRRIKAQPFPALTAHDRASRLIDYWSEGTARTALDWNLESILKDLPLRATSRAKA